MNDFEDVSFSIPRSIFQQRLIMFDLVEKKKETISEGKESKKILE